MLQVDEPKMFKYSLILPLLVVLFIWLIKFIDDTDSLELYKFGVYPRKLEGFLGVFFAPLIHSDYNHLVSNTVPLLVLGTGIIYFYRSLAYKVIGFVWLLSGTCVWIGARESYHIGASGLIYGLASFLFFSGLIRKDVRLTAISLLVVFLYGSLVWGIFPIFPRISWEYHFFGGMGGLIASIIYRKEGPAVKIWNFKEEEDVDEEIVDEENSTKPID